MTGSFAPVEMILEPKRLVDHEAVFEIVNHIPVNSQTRTTALASRSEKIAAVGLNVRHVVARSLALSVGFVLQVGGLSARDFSCAHPA